MHENVIINQIHFNMFETELKTYNTKKNWNITKWKLRLFLRIHL